MPINNILYFGDFFVLPAALAGFAWLALAYGGLAALPGFCASLALGVFGWTLAEYGVHRWLYHHAPYLSQLHGRHHETPDAYIGMPSFLSGGLVILLTYVPFFRIWPLFADGFASGALIGYFGYMTVHHAVHHWTIGPGDALYQARLRHLAHHYHDEADFGVVTGFWDRVFRTAGRRRIRPARV